MDIKKTIYRILICLVPICFMVGCEAGEVYKDGIYYGESDGYYSVVTVSVEVVHGHITSVNILSHEEPEDLATIVFDELPPKMIKANSWDVDVVAGATYTSESVISAVRQALTDGSDDE